MKFSTAVAAAYIATAIVVTPGASRAQQSAADDFLCYKARTSTSFSTITGIRLTDPIEEWTHKVRKVRQLCAPTDASYGEINDLATHLEVYKITTDVEGSSDLPAYDVHVVNRFGELLLEVKKADLLLVPTMTAEGPPGPPPLVPTNDIDHYKCYKARARYGLLPPSGTTVTLANSFTNPSTTVLGLSKVRHFCTPVSKNGELVKKSGRAVVCYKVFGVAGTLPFNAIELDVANQLDSGRRVLSREATLCVYSTLDSIRYSYDDLGRLAGVVTPTGQIATYSYDAVGNLLAIGRPESRRGPSILNFAPTCGPPGTPVTITGARFWPDATQMQVRFGGTNGPLSSVSSATTTELVVTVPPGAASGPMWVGGPSGNVESIPSFTVGCAEPTITGFTPSSGAPTATVTITGTNFQPTALDNRVTFNGAIAVVISATTTNLTVRVPGAATSGRITVSTLYGQAVSATDFVVLPPPTPTATSTPTPTPTLSATPTSTPYQFFMDAMVFYHGSPNTGSAPRYYLTGSQVSEAKAAYVLPFSSRHSTLTIQCRDPITSGYQLFTYMKNGVAVANMECGIGANTMCTGVDTPLPCCTGVSTGTCNTTTCESLGDVDLFAPDRVTLRSLGGSGNTSTVCSASVNIFHPVLGFHDGIILFGGDSLGIGAGTRYCGPSGQTSNPTKCGELTEAGAAWIAPNAATISGIAVRVADAATDGGLPANMTETYTVRNVTQGCDSTATVTIDGNAASPDNQQKTDANCTGACCSVGAGDLLVIKLVHTGSTVATMNRHIAATFFGARQPLVTVYSSPTGFSGTKYSGWHDGLANSDPNLKWRLNRNGKLHNLWIGVDVSVGVPLTGTICTGSSSPPSCVGTPTCTFSSGMSCHSTGTATFTAEDYVHLKAAAGSPLSNSRRVRISAEMGP